MKEIVRPMEGSSKKSARLPSFIGLRKDFQTWWIRFIAYAGAWKFQAVLRIGGESDLPPRESDVIDEMTSIGKLAAQAKQRNAVTMVNLTMTFETEGSLRMIYKSMNKDWPEGLAHEVVAQLFKKYSPENRISRVERTTITAKWSGYEGY